MYEKMSVSEISRMIRNREVKPSEICADFLSRIDKQESEINAFINIDGEAVMQRAKDLDGQDDGRTVLFGIPVAVKDNICTRDLPTTCGSKMLENFRPPYDATVISRLREQGAIIIGKTNMDEFAMGGSTETSFFGATRNSHDLTRTPGGTSGGSAAAVAAGMSPCSLGSDTGGSIRQPAGFCGLVGYKPSYGAVSRNGLVSYAGSFDQIGPITRTVSDAALLAAAISGYDATDAVSNPNYSPDFSDIIEGRAISLKGRRIGILKECLADGINDDVRAAVMSAADIYKSLGAELVDISVPAIEHSLPVYYIIALAEASSNLAKFDGVQFGYRAANCSDTDSLYINSRTEGFGAEVKKRIILGTYILSADNYEAYYKKARAGQAMLREQFKAVFEKCDVILAPITPGTAYKLGEKEQDPVKLYLNDICTVPANIAGLPAISVPCAKDASGLPIGVQLLGSRFEDAQLLAFAHALEHEISG